MFSFPHCFARTCSHCAIDLIVLLFYLRSSSREMRNRAEKQRRDKLNAYISELYSLVPSAAAAPRKLDKTSTLRLSANFLRIHQSKIYPRHKEFFSHPVSLWSQYYHHFVGIAMSWQWEWEQWVGQKMSFQFSFSVNISKWQLKMTWCLYVHHEQLISCLRCQMTIDQRTELKRIFYLKFKFSASV